MPHFNLSNKYSDLTALVVDDFPAMLKTVGSMLTAIGFKHVYKAANGKEALLILAEEQVDLIVSDWNMPKMNGVELLKAVRMSDLGYQHIPFMMLTANVNQDDVRQAIDLGVSEYLIKPFNQNTLKDKIATALITPVRTQVSSIASTASEPTPAKQISKSTLLIVDDNPNNVTVLTELLKNDYRLKASLSGQKALDICQQEPKPDLILLDIMMPDMDGLAVCSQLKSDPLTEHIPIIFISALSQDQDVIKGLSLGAVDYITKPISPEITKARIATHIRLVEQRKAMSQQLDTLVENARLKADIERIIHHDLKGPLSTIMAATEMLETKQLDCENEIDILHSSSAAMQQMIDNHMLLYKLENDSYQTDLSILNAFKAVNEVLYGLKQKSKERQVFLSSKVPADLAFHGNPVLNRNMLYNLLINAIEAAPTNSKVQIATTASAESITIHIHNDGAVPADIRPVFFDKFVTAGKAKGTGIGTYSAKLSAKAQGGDIEFVSGDNGTTLSVTLQRA
ncbi:response regulator [Shewanella sp. Scap07]|uniref:response regulator n=1 Tax=Shewanella sp. Scap07 TaxID=2589987 RepID=UPI0015C0051C|nr:response regulator [Shewanella sp. Scap07]